MLIKEYTELPNGIYKYVHPYHSDLYAVVYVNYGRYIVDVCFDTGSDTIPDYTTISDTLYNALYIGWAKVLEFAIELKGES